MYHSPFYIQTSPELTSSLDPGHYVCFCSGLNVNLFCDMCENFLRFDIGSLIPETSNHQVKLGLKNSEKVCNFILALVHLLILEAA